MALREEVVLEIRQAEAQISRLQSQLDAVAQPINVPVQIQGQQALFALEQQIADADATVDVNVQTFGLESADQAFDELNAEIAQTEEELQQAQRRADQLGDELDRTGDQGVGAFGRLRNAIGPLAATLAAGIGIREVVQQLGAAVTAAAELEQSIGGVGAVFGSAADPILEFSEAAAEAVGLSELAANTLAARLGGQLQAFGFSVQEAVTETQELIQVGADLAATYGGSVSDAIEAISALLRGETNPIERYAIAINQTAINAEALRLGLVGTVGEIDLQVKAVAALSLLNEQAARSQGQFAREAETTAGQLERLRAEAANAQAEIGEALVPAFESGVEILRDLVPALEDAAPAFALIADTAGAAVQAAAPFFVTLGDAASDLGNAIEGLPTDIPLLDFLGSIGTSTLNPLGAFTQVIRDFTSGLETGISESALSDFLDLVAEKAADGREPVELLGAAFETLQENGVATVGFLQDLAGAAGASDVQLIAFTQQLIRGGDAAGLTADEIEQLRDLLRELLGLDLNAVDFGRRGLGDAIPVIDETTTALDRFREAEIAAFDPVAAADALSERFEDLPTVVTNLDELEAALSRAGISLSDFLTQEADASGIVGAFTQAETDILTAISNIEEAIPRLRESVSGAFELEVDEGQIDADTSAFADSLEEQLQAKTDFEIDLSEIAITAPDVAALLAAEGVDVAGQIADALVLNPEDLARAQAALEGSAESLAEGTAEAYAEFLRDLTPQQIAQLAVFGADNFVSPAIRSQLADSAQEMAEVLTEALSGQTISPELIIDLSNAQITGLGNVGTIPVGPGGGVDTPGTGTGGGTPGGPPGAQFQVNVAVNNPVVVDEQTAGTQAAQQVAATVSLLAARPN